jgi:hypothetical protein
MCDTHGNLRLFLIIFSGVLLDLQKFPVPFMFSDYNFDQIIFKSGTQSDQKLTNSTHALRVSCAKKEGKRKNVYTSITN